MDGSERNPVLDVGWVAEPNGRGTLSLLVSCVLTLVLCVWTAMHLNVPVKNETTGRSWLRHSRWVLAGVFGPELVVFAAWRQWNSAKAIVMAHRKRHGDGNRLASDEIEKGHSRIGSPRQPWTMIHGYYASMGGFTFEVDERLVDSIPRPTRLSLTAHGVALLIECGLAPDIRKDEIIDKSKANNLAKALVCVQALWLAVQIVGRLIAHLPVTLLELNTLGHAICALAIYVLWWNKPLSVKEPTELEGDWTAPVCAFMFMSSQISGSKHSRRQGNRFTRVEPELEGLVYIPPRSAPTSTRPYSVSKLHFTERIDEDFEDSTTSGRFEPARGSSESPSSMDLVRWRLATQAVRDHPAILARFQSASSSPKSLLIPSHDELVVTCVPDWPSGDLLRRVPSLIMGMTLWCSSMIYGGLHLAAWGSSSFPSTTERDIWRFSAIYVAGSGLIWLIINLLAQVFPGVNYYWERVNAVRGHWVIYAILGILLGVGGAAYIFARLFFVIEAFVSIRQLPAAAYATPEWTQLIPHL